MCCKAHATYFPELPYIEYVLYACSGRILYLSGTDLQDYLLEPQTGKAEGHRYTLLETRKDMDAALQHHLQLLSSAEAQPFQVLTQELGEYWCVLEPTF